jgi:hypothetical protein
VLNDLPHEHRPAADWGMIEQLCVLVSHQRNDLAWVHDLLGWCHERQGRRAQAAAAYYAGRHAPAFTNQAVRLRTHWYDQQYGKFSIAQLLQLQKSHHQPEAGSELRHDDDQQSDVWEQIQSDPYLQLFPGAPAQLLARVTEYWEQQAQEHFAAERYEAAYHCFVQAGWDLGAPSIDAYRRILQSIVDAAAQANWPARARIAETHLHCLTKR